MSDKSDNLLNNVVFFFFLIFLFSSAFSIAISQISLGLSLAAFLVLIFTKRYNPFSNSLRPVYLAIALYLLWSVATSLVNPEPIKSLQMLKEEWLFCIIPIGVYLFRQRQYRHVLILALAAGIILVSIYGVIQHFTGANWFKSFALVKARDGTFYAAGGFHHNLTYGNYLAVAAMFLVSLAIIKFRQLLKLPYLLFAIAGFMGLLGTVMSYSRTAIATLPIASVVLTWLRGKRWAIVSTTTIIVLTAVSFLLFSELAFKYKFAFKRDLFGEHEASRLYIWKKSWAIATENPIFGVGRNNFESAYTIQLGEEADIARTRSHAHNDILNFAAISGIPGAVIFALLWIMVFYKLHQIWHRSEQNSDKKTFAGAAAIAGLTFFLTSLTEATFADEEVRQLLMAVWAAGLWPLYSIENDRLAEPDETS